MKIFKNQYGYTGTYHLSSDSILRKIHIKNVDNERAIKVFENHTYKLLLITDVNMRIDGAIYKRDYAEYIDNDDFKKEAIEAIIKCLNRLQVAFIGLTYREQYKPAKRNNQKILIDILNYETGCKPIILEECIGLTDGFILFEGFIYVNLLEIHRILLTYKDNIDTYIDRFLSLENLNGDPVLHFVTLYSLYEYINKTSDNYLKRLFIEKGLEKKFRNTRNFAAHGSVEGVELKEVLEEFLEVSPSGFHSFDRYIPSHINLVNAVIGDAQPIIQQYLRDELTGGVVTVKFVFPVCE
ncbi:MAG: hypothetical protein WCP16_07860 [Pseudanabaena sp. ELA645]|jgi:hypothetical protein